MLRKVIKIVLLISCLFTIFMFSNDNGTSSSKKSDTVIISSIRLFTNKKLNNKIKRKYINKYVFLVRKMAHFIIYLILGLLVISLLEEYMILDKRVLLLTIIFVLLYACSDELHQYFIPGREARIGDVLLDTFGGGIGEFLYYIFRRKRL